MHWLQFWNHLLRTLFAHQILILQHLFNKNRGWCVTGEGFLVSHSIITYLNKHTPKISIIEHAKTNRVVVATVTFLLTHSCWQIITQIHYILLAVHLLRLRTQKKKFAMNVLLKSVSKWRRRWLTSCKLKPQSTQKKCYCVAKCILLFFFIYFKCVTTWSWSWCKNISAEFWTQFVNLII